MRLAALALGGIARLTACGQSSQKQVGGLLAAASPESSPSASPSEELYPIPPQWATTPFPSGRMAVSHPWNWKADLVDLNGQDGVQLTPPNARFDELDMGFLMYAWFPDPDSPTADEAAAANRQKFERDAKEGIRWYEKEPGLLAGHRAYVFERYETANPPVDCGCEPCDCVMRTYLTDYDNALLEVVLHSMTPDWFRKFEQTAEQIRATVRPAESGSGQE